jgi:hypothetical protein
MCRFVRLLKAIDVWLVAKEHLKVLFFVGGLFMSKKFLFLIPFVLVLGLTYTCYGAPGTFKLDFDSDADANACGDSLDVVDGFTCWVLETDNGSDVNGITLDILPDTIDLTAPTVVRTKRDETSDEWIANDVGVQLYPDMVYARYPSGLNIVLWELGAGQDCNITLWCYDNQSENRRQADWSVNDGEATFRTDFVGGESWPWCLENPCDYNSYAYDVTVTADALGRITMTSVIGPNSTSQQVFAFACGLRVIPKGTYTPSTYSHRPLPYDGEINVSVKTNLRWRKGATAATRNVYLSTSFSDVNDGVVGARIAAATGANSIDPYGATGFLKMETTYYWRVDEIIGGTPQKGEVWSFTTRSSCITEDWNSYPTYDSLIQTWKDYIFQDDPTTSAAVDLEVTIARSGLSMKYEFGNGTFPPYYSEVRANTADIGMDPNWLGLNAQALSLFFYGQAANPTTEPMSMILKDSDGDTASVAYSGDINNLKVEAWQQWNITLSSFTDANASLNLKNISQIIIRFGDPPAGNDGTVYFDDLYLYPTRCVQLERGAGISVVDFAPGGSPPGDCIVDIQELEVLADTWLYEDVAIPTKNPGTTGLVGYWSMNEGDSNKIYPTAYDASLGIEPNNLIGYMDPCDDVGLSSGDISWVSGVPMQFTNGGPWVEGSALQFGKVVAGRFASADGLRVQFGPEGFGPDDSNNFDPAAPDGQITLGIWAKWMGRHLDKDKCQGVISKRRDWAANATGVQFMFEVDTYPAPRGTFALRAFRSAGETGDLYAPTDILMGFIGQWIHLAVTFDATDTNDACILYLNGSEVARGPYHFGVGDPCNIGLTIGSTGALPVWPEMPETFKGTLDEAYIFNRALEPNEVAYLADESPWDGIKTVPIPSAAEIYKGEPSGERVVNFRDFAMIASLWLEEDMYP